MKFPRQSAAVLILVSVLALVGCHSSSNTTSTRRVDGSGVLDQESRQVAAFARVLFAAIGEVDIEQGAQQALSIEAEDNLLTYLETDVIGDELLISIANGIDLNPTMPIQFNLTVVDLAEVTHAGVGSIDVPDLVAPQLSLSLAGVGDLDVTNLTGQTLDVNHAGVGEIRVTGTVDSQTVMVSGVGDYDGEDLVSADAVVTSSAVGSVTVRVSDTLDVTINGPGSVFYIGNPVITSSITGGGTLQKIG